MLLYLSLFDRCRRFDIFFDELTDSAKLVKDKNQHKEDHKQASLVIVVFDLDAHNIITEIIHFSIPVMVNIAVFDSIKVFCFELSAAPTSTVMIEAAISADMPPFLMHEKVGDLPADFTRQKPRNNDNDAKDIEQTRKNHFH